MGIEYQHWLLVRDLKWEPTAETPAAVHAVLGKWGLAASEPIVRDLTDGGWRKARRQKLDGRGAWPDTMALHYKLPYDDPPKAFSSAVATVLGPPKKASGKRRLRSVIVVLGRDLRTIAIGEPVYTEVIEPPLDEEDEPIEAYPDPPIELGIGEHWPASMDTPLPETEFSTTGPRHAGLDDFTGLLRSGVRLDCGSDAPALMDASGILPAREFVVELEHAFGTGLVEVGGWE